MKKYLFNFQIYFTFLKNEFNYSLHFLLLKNLYTTLHKSFAHKVIDFNSRLELNVKLPEGIKLMNPFKDNPDVKKINTEFYKKFYSDNRIRRLILGINPGRFGAGITGIPFTDTKRLEEFCGIKIEGVKSHEPSSVFVYNVIKAYGGVKKFYANFYIGAVCPLGFIKRNGKGKFVNYNYYDSTVLMDAVSDFIVYSIRKQIDFGINTETCYCLGSGKNYDFLLKINTKYGFFGEIIPLEHPRFIMQYRAKKHDEYVEKYIKKLGSK